MKFVLVVFCTVSVNAFSTYEEWGDFKIQQKKSYSIQEEKLRYAIFQKNVKAIEEHNKKYENGETSYKMGINKFTDMTLGEYKSSLGYKQKYKMAKYLQRNKVRSVANIPDAVDWRIKGAVTKVKDQGSCGSCWAFSVTGTVESQYFLLTGNLTSMSQQEMVDCDDTCQGCKGGRLEDALKWVQENGLTKESDYPYEAVSDICRLDANKVVVEIKEYTAVTPDDEEELKKAVATVGPVAVAIWASYDFRFYSSGIFDDAKCLTSILNHGVLVVGYNTTEDGLDYWIVKNSWGTSWGDEGYVHMSRNKNNQCGIACEPFYVVI